MKRLILLGAFLVCCLSLDAGVARAASDQAYVGLFADEYHSTCIIVSPGSLVSFTTWVWFLPGTSGVMAAEFHIVFPSNVIVGNVTCNTHVLGCYGPPEDIAFDHCLTEWEWGIKVECVLTDALPSIIELVPHSGDSSVLVATCELGFPLEPAIVLMDLYLNQTGRCFFDAAEPVSWGAIKSLYQ